MPTYILWKNLLDKCLKKRFKQSVNAKNLKNKNINFLCYSKLTIDLKNK